MFSTELIITLYISYQMMVPTPILLRELGMTSNLWVLFAIGQTHTCPTTCQNQSGGKIMVIMVIILIICGPGLLEHYANDVI